MCVSIPPFSGFVAYIIAVNELQNHRDCVKGCARGKRDQENCSNSALYFTFYETRSFGNASNLRCHYLVIASDHKCGKPQEQVLALFQKSEPKKASINTKFVSQTFAVLLVHCCNYDY